MKEDMTTSSSKFQHSDGQSSSGLELKLATLQEVEIFFLLWLILLKFRVGPCE